MERRVKERLVGATILVALIVLIVPALLSGPKLPSAPPLAQGLPASNTRGVTIDLDTSHATPEVSPSESASTAQSAPASSAASTAAPSEDAQAATGGAGSKESAQDSTPTVTTLKAQESAPPPLESAPAPPKSVPGSPPAENAPSRRAWAVQLGSFASKVNAEKLVHQLQAHGGPGVYVLSSGSGASLRYRVRMGPLADRGSAEREVAKLKAERHAATVVPPAS